MKSRQNCLLCLSLGAVALLAGCATTTKTPETVHQFEPLPVAKVRSQELSPVTPTPVNDLLREAQKEFEAANTAQEQNDRQASLQHYTKMLELLGQANLDPSIFYNLRSEFERILNSTEQHAKVEEQSPALKNLEPVAPGALATGDLEIEFPLSERVMTELNEIQNDYPKQFQAGLDRSHKYLPYVEAEFAKAGLPKDLVWLAMVESQFSAKIVSRAGAGGMWQFMRGTGHRYNLRTDSYVDERYNWQKSTQAAVVYLKELYDQFGQWPLAISAYNMGEHGLERAIASTGGERDLWKLLETPPASSQIQLETKKFYAKLLATVLIAKNPEKFGFKTNELPPEENVRVSVNGSYSLRALDQVCGLPEGTLQTLNQDLIRGVTPPGREHQLAVPVNYGSVVLASLPKVQEVKPEPVYASASKGRYHTVKRGETLTAIADKYSVSVDTLMKTNKLRTARYLLPGRKLYLPTDAAASEPEAEEQSERIEQAKLEKTDVEQTKAVPAKSKSEPEEQSITYTVKKGDTLSGIAQKHKVSIKSILRWNKKSTQVLHEGDKLTLKSLQEMHDEDAETEMFHTVKSGECCEEIAKQYGVKLDDLLAWNDLKKDSTINAGKKLIIKGFEGDIPNTDPAPDSKAPEKEQVAKAETKEASASASKTASKPAAKTEEKPADKPAADSAPRTHTIAGGDTLSGIADKYKVSVKDLIAWNNLKSDGVIQTGQKLVVEAASAPKASKPEAEKPTTTAKAEPKSEAKKAAPAEEKAEPKNDAPAGKKTTVTVGKGDCPSTIAEKYKVKVSDLYKWNNWTKSTVLQVGQKVTVYSE